MNKVRMFYHPVCWQTTATTTQHNQAADGLRPHLRCAGPIADQQRRTQKTWRPTAQGVAFGAPEAIADQAIPAMTRITTTRPRLSANTPTGQDIPVENLTPAGSAHRRSRSWAFPRPTGPEGPTRETAAGHLNAPGPDCAT